MLFTNLFSKKQLAKAASDRSVGSEDSSYRTLDSTNSKGSCEDLSGKKPKRHCKKTPTELHAAKALVKLLNSPDLKAEDFVQLWTCDEKKRVMLEDGICLNAQDFAQAFIALKQSFLDFQVSYEMIRVRGSSVTIEGVRCSGTHTGAP